MSHRDLENYLERNPVALPESAVQTSTLIVVSDSKGSYLAETINQSYPESTIVWKCLRGHSTKQIKSYIFQNIHQFVKSFGRILIAVWTGTCYLTYKPYKGCLKTKARQGSYKYIDLSPVSIEDIIQDYNDIASLKSQYRDLIDFVFLEVPYYQTQKWNTLKAGVVSDASNEVDTILVDKIDHLNRGLQEINKRNGILAPKFALDLLICRKNKSNKSKKINFDLLSEDGIHPSLILSKYWVRRLALVLLVPFCFK